MRPFELALETLARLILGPANLFQARLTDKHKKKLIRLGVTLHRHRFVTITTQWPDYPRLDPVQDIRLRSGFWFSEGFHTFVLSSTAPLWYAISRREKAKLNFGRTR